VLFQYPDIWCPCAYKSRFNRKKQGLFKFKSQFLSFSLRMASIAGNSGQEPPRKESMTNM